MMNKILSTCLMLAWMTSNPAMAESDSFVLDRADLQAFERSYEIWIGDLIHQISPKTKVNVISQFQYTSNPDLIQAYEEKMAMMHLPGVPEMIDLDMQPTQNPISDLVVKQSFKVILDQKPSSDLLRLMKDLLSSKLPMNPSRGDGLEFDYLSSPLLSNSHGKLGLMILLFSAFAFVGGFHWNRKRKELKENSAKKAGETLGRIYRRINPVENLVTVEPEAFSGFIRNQDRDLLVQAMSYGSVGFLQAVLKSFDGEDRVELFRMFESNRLKISAKKARYAQIYLLARLKDEMKCDAFRKVDELVVAMEGIRLKNEIMSGHWSELKASEAIGGFSGKDEVSYEQSI